MKAEVIRCEEDAQKAYEEFVFKVFKIIKFIQFKVVMIAGANRIVFKVFKVKLVVKTSRVKTQSSRVRTRPGRHISGCIGIYEFLNEYGISVRNSETCECCSISFVPNSHGLDAECSSGTRCDDLDY